MVNRSGKSLLAGSCAVVAMAAAAGCVALAVHHPLSPLVACVACLVIALTALLTPTSWPIWVLPLVPVAGLATWTGWLAVEELDLLVLAVAAGLHARWAIVLRHEDRGARHPAAMGLLAWTGWAVLGAALLVGTWRGVADAGGIEWGWWQGYHESMNSIRLFKAWPLATLLLPTWVMAMHRDSARIVQSLSAGMTAMLGVMGLLTVWERAAFTGLLNFSADYRTTALFWEMHVGGAALDACLAMTFPFAWHALMQSRTPRGWFASAACVALGTYACVTTFSRIVFMAVPLGLALMGGLALLQRLRAGPSRDSKPTGWVAAAVLLLAFTGAAAIVFPGGGYRGMLALLLAFAMLLPMVSTVRSLALVHLVQALAFGVAWIAVNTALSVAFDKGAYLGLAVAALVATGALWSGGALGSGARVPAWCHRAGLAGHLAVIAGVPLVATHWGDVGALPPALASAVALLVALAVARLTPQAPWPASLRWQGGLACAFGAAVIMVGAFSGGAYLSERFENTESDKSSRVEHWRQSLDLLGGSADWWLGKGLGRYVGQHFISGLTVDQTGDYRWQHGDQGDWLLLTGGKHTLGWGEMLRISQRVSPPLSPVTVTLDARTAQTTALHVEICEKHLLYNGACVTAEVGVKGEPGRWQSVQARPVGNVVSRGKWFAPNLISFSLAVATPGGKVEVDNLSVKSADGSELLANGGFTSGLAHWYFSSDRHHMPWHAKNLWVHVMFEQGALGVALMGLLLVGTLGRLSLGAARQHPLAGPVAASIVGVVVVGLVDSLVDMPRVAFMLYLVLGIALTLPGPRPRVAGVSRGVTSRSGG